jgi:hypothetical protein
MDYQNNSSDMNYDEKELKMLCFHCFEVLTNILSKKSEEVPFPNKFKNVFNYIKLKRK